MYHDDGLEVWIESRLSTGEDARYEELQLHPKDNHKGHYLQCLVPAKAQKCRIVFKVLPQFDMHGASALHVGVAQPGNDLERRDFSVMHSKQVPGAQCFHIWNSLKASRKEDRPIDDNVGTAFFAFHAMIIQLTPLQEANSLQYSEIEFCLDARPGCVVMELQRGHSQWVNEDDDAANTSTYFGRKKSHKALTFKQIPGPHGRKYMFEFCPQDEATINETRMKMLRQLEGESLVPERTLDGAAPDLPESRDELEIPVSSEQRTEQHAHRRTTKAVKKVPRVCDCSEACNQSASVAANSRGRITVGHAGSLARGRRSGPGSGPGSGNSASSNSGGGINHLTSAESAPETADGHDQEVIAPRCSTCKRVIKAPGDKELVWRNDRNDWVLGRRGARGDDPPQHEVAIEQVDASCQPQGGFAESDDDEEMPPIKRDHQDQKVERPLDAQNDRHDNIEATVSRVEDDVEPLQINGDLGTTQPPAPIVTYDSAQKPLDQNNNCKRQACSPARGSDGKRPCVEIDLTLDDDEDDNVVVKQEPEKRTGASSWTSRPEQMDVDALRHEITAIELETQVLELKQRKLACQRELQKKQLQSGSLAKPLKIEEGN